MKYLVCWISKSYDIPTYKEFATLQEAKEWAQLGKEKGRTILGIFAGDWYENVDCDLDE